MSQATTLEQFLSSPKSYDQIDFNSQELQDADCVRLASALRENNILTHLNLSKCRIGNVGATEIGRLLSDNNTLTHLILDNNDIGDMGAIAIAQGLATNIKLTHIHLQNNHIGDKGVLAIEEAVPEKNIIAGFYINNNHISHDTISKLKKITKIADVNIADQAVNPESLNLSPDLSIENREVLKINELIREGNDRLQEKNPKGLLLLGRTGAGKSTLGYLLAGRELEAVQDEETDSLVLQAKNPIDGIIISHNNISETKIPNKFSIEDLVVWDCPGFKDTDPTHEIANAFYIKKLFETTELLKFVLVVPFAEIAVNRGISFIDTVDLTVKSFTDIDILSGNVALVVTQAPRGKNVGHIVTSIERILNQNDNIDTSTHKMIGNLCKSVHIFHVPNRAGEIIISTNMLSAIDDSIKYCEGKSGLANMAVSQEALDYGHKLLNIVNQTFLRLIEVIELAIARPFDATDVDSEDNVFMQNYELIKNWVPSTAEHHNIDNSPKEKRYFPKQDLLKELHDIFNDKFFNSFEDGIEILTQAMHAFERFSRGEDAIHIFDEGVGQLQFTVQKYIYVLKQQFEYIKFFSELCKSDLLGFDRLSHVVEQCRKINDYNLEYQVKHLKLDEKIADPNYYTQAIEYLKIYADSDSCKDSCAKAYIQLGKIAEEAENPNDAIKFYTETIKYNSRLPETYNKLGNLFFNRSEYSKAIECYKITNNAFEIGNCFSRLVTEDPKNYELRMQIGDYWVSNGLFEKAKKHFLHASSLTGEAPLKKAALLKIDSLLKGKSEELATNLVGMINSEDYNNFKLVTDEFCISLAGDVNGPEGESIKIIDL